MAQRLAHGLYKPFIGSSSLPSATKQTEFTSELYSPSSRNGGMEDAPRPERGGETHVGSTPTFGTKKICRGGGKEDAPLRGSGAREGILVRSQSAALIEAHSSREPG